MPTLTRPGVYVDESSFPTYTSAAIGQAQAAFVGWSARGPLTPFICNSWRDFVSTFGGFDAAFPPSPLALAVYGYFTAGGTSCAVVRVVNQSAQGPVAGELSLNDQGTTPAPTLKVSAINPGAWGNELWIDVLPGTVVGATGVPQTFTLQVKYKGTMPANLVERWENLSMVPGSTYLGQNNYAVDIINSTFTGSKYIQVQDLQSSNSAPDNNPAPITADATATPAVGNLTGGDDGQPPTFPDTQAAIQMLDQYPDRPFVLNLPGATNQTDIGNAVSYAQARGDVFVVIDCPPGMSPDSMATFASGLSSTAQAAIYYPQLKIADPYSPRAGVTRLVPPGGFVTGLYIATDSKRGVAKAPAGLGASLQGVQGLEAILTNTDLGNLTQSNVNCIISVPGSGIVVWGARTLSAYLVTRYVPTERSLIYLQTNFIAMTKFAVFEPNDWVLWNQIVSILSQFLTSFWQSGGLQGNSIQESYYIICDGTNNPPSQIEQGIVNVEVGVALQRPAEFVVIKLGQWAGGQSVQLVNS